jgi:hypothetical protein
MGEPSYCDNVDFDRFVHGDISNAHDFYRSLIGTVRVKVESSQKGHETE